MLEIESIRKDLQVVKYYYQVKILFESTYSSGKVIYDESTLRTVRKYDRLMEKAPVRLRLAYDNLYRCCKTQKAYAIECGVTEKYVQILHKRIIVFLYNSINR